MDPSLQGQQYDLEHQLLLSPLEIPLTAISSKHTPNTREPRSYVSAASHEDSIYLGTSVPYQASLTWRPYTMHWAYLFAQCVLALLMCGSLKLALRYSVTNRGFPDDRFPVDSPLGVLVFRLLPVAICLCFWAAWVAIDVDFKRLAPFTNMANPYPARRGCVGSKNPVAGARGKDSLLLTYFPYDRWTADLRSPFRGHWVVATTFWTSSIPLVLTSFHASLFSPRTFNVPTAADKTSGFHFERIANWQQLSEAVHTTPLGREQAKNELRLMLNVSIEGTRRARPWRSRYWSAVPFSLCYEVNGTSDILPMGWEMWQAQTVVFSPSLDCRPAGALSTSSNRDLTVVFQDGEGCSAEQVYPLPSSGQYLSFWNFSQSDRRQSCRDRQLLAWGKTSVNSTVTWTSLSCAPRYQIATVPVAVNSYGTIYVPTQDRLLSHDIKESIFKYTATDFTSPNLNAFIRSVFFDTNLTNLVFTGRQSSHQPPVFEGVPQPALQLDGEALLQPNNLTATVQNIFARVVTRVFPDALLGRKSTSDHVLSIDIPDGVHLVTVKRYAMNNGLVVYLVFGYAIMAVSALGLAITVASMKKYRTTGLKFDITSAGTAGLMLLLHRSRKVLDADFKDLDQSMHRSNFKRRLNEKMYRLGYWQDACGVFWGISRERLEEFEPSDDDSVPRIESDEKLRAFRYRKAKCELHRAFTSVMVLLMSALAASCVYFAVTSSQKGFELNTNLVYSHLLWQGLPSFITQMGFEFWWKTVDKFFRTSQPFAGLNSPNYAHENICLDYRTDWGLTLPWRAARNKHWKLSFVGTVSILTQIMMGISGTLFVFRIVPESSPVQFLHNITWRTDAFSAPKLEPYIYELANSIPGSKARSSWTDSTSLYLPVTVNNSTNTSSIVSISMESTWSFDTQSVHANLSSCINLQVNSSLLVNYTATQFQGKPGMMLNNLDLETSDCTFGRKVESVCGKPSNISLTSNNRDEAVCSSWSLLTSLNGSCSHEGWWWIYWLSGPALGHHSSGLPVFSAQDPPIVTSILCDPAIWLNDVAVTDFDPTTKFISSVVTKSTKPLAVDRPDTNISLAPTYRQTFNSLLKSTLMTTRAGNDSVDLMTFLMSRTPELNTLNNSLGLRSAASLIYSSLFTIYTRNEETLWTPSPQPSSSPGLIHRFPFRVSLRTYSFVIYVTCLMILLTTLLFVRSSINDRRLPRWVSTLADVVSYFYRSPVLMEDFEGMQDVRDEKELKRRLMAKKRRYVFGAGMGKDGVGFVGIGDADRMRVIPRRRFLRQQSSGSFFA